MTASERVSRIISESFLLRNRNNPVFVSARIERRRGETVACERDAYRPDRWP